MPSRYYKKYIRIPPGESIDIRDIMPIVQHPLFQRLRFVSQLSNILFVFPGASHNRFEHALGVYGKTARLSKRLAEEGVLTAGQARNVALFGLLHDIGHGPFSHLIEDLTPYNHKKNGFRILGELEQAIEASGGNYAVIRKFFENQDPLGGIVSDKNLGMDKIDYLDRDTFHIGFGQRPDVETILDYLDYIDGRVAIDKKALEAAKQIQRLYTYMYKEVYLNKSSLIAKRFLQKMIALWISTRRVDPEDLWLLTDGELMARIYTDSDPRIQFLYTSYMKRVAPSTGVVLRVDRKQSRERVAGKQIKVIGETRPFFDQFAARASSRDLEHIESQIARLLKVPEHTVLVVPTLSPHRFAPQDIWYHDDGTVHSLAMNQPAYFESMKDELEEYLSVRVCIIGNRSLVYAHAEKIHQLIRRVLRERDYKKKPSRNLELL